MHKRTQRNDFRSLPRHGASKRKQSTPVVVRNVFGLPGVTDSLPKQVEPPWSMRRDTTQSTEWKPRRYMSKRWASVHVRCTPSRSRLDRMVARGPFVVERVYVYENE